MILLNSLKITLSNLRDSNLLSVTSPPDIVAGDMLEFSLDEHGTLTLHVYQ